VCSLNLKSIQIQTSTLAFKPNLVPKAFSSLPGPAFPKARNGPIYLCRPSYQISRSSPSSSPPQLLPAYPLTKGTQQSVPFIPIFFAFSSSRSTEPHHARAGDGAVAPARRLVHRGPVRARWGSESTAGWAMTLLPPHRAHPRRDRAAATGTTCPGRRTARGTGGKSPELPAASLQKTPGMRITNAKPPTPLGFSTLHRLCLRRGRRGKERAAAAPRRGRKEPGTRSRE
jgi:hypothetical protein